jgi:PAS domain S-box-containing protein
MSLDQHPDFHRLLQAVVEASPAGIVIVDQNGHVVLVNAEAERMFGYDRSELLGQSIEVLVPKRYRGDHPNYRTTFENDPSVRMMGAGRDLFGLRKNGTEFPVEIGLTPIQTSQGLFVLSVIIDITERKKAEEALREHSLALERSNRDLKEFATIASHDLQEPLRKIVAFGDMLNTRYGGAFDDAGSELLARIHRATRRMQQLVEGMLAYARLSDQGVPFTMVNLEEIVREVLDDLEGTGESSHRHVEIESLPAVHGNPTQMRQLMQNLLSNALKFAKKGEPCHVRVLGELLDEPEKNERVCRIVIEDNGVGFDEKYAQQVFGMLQRLHDRSQYEGSGMGLAICRRIVERHGGTIGVNSSPGVGSRFVVTLPSPPQ